MKNFHELIIFPKSSILLWILFYTCYTYEVLFALDDGHVHVVRGGADILKLLVGEDVERNQMDLRVTVLASLRGRHLHNLQTTK